MTVTKHELEGPDDLHVRAMALCSDAKWDAEKGEAVGEPTECALVNDAAKLGFYENGNADRYERVGEAPFDSGRKMMSVVVKTPRAPSSSTPRAAPTWFSAAAPGHERRRHRRDPDRRRREQIMAANKAMADQALRVLAAASPHAQGACPRLQPRRRSSTTSSSWASPA